MRYGARSPDKGEGDGTKLIIYLKMGVASQRDRNPSEVDKGKDRT